ncbi:MAG: prepilin-type N-terminal cleavage/methylation domain-containing protein [Fimbriimonadaceae bacterium]|nr:prepilin-type N-terminal cleavage/methylation domain-containing protein [Fimbriimonadaceae bacterium]
MRRQRGFTLVELLVVIAILALLAAILFPVFAKARERARVAACASNLKQLGSALQLYADDYEEFFPNAVDWADRHFSAIWSSQPQYLARIAAMPDLNDALDPYLRNRQVWACPSDWGCNYEPIANVTVNNSSMHRTYGMSYSYRTALTFNSQRASQLSDPAGTLLLNDANGAWHYGDDGRFGSYRYNVLFADGHVKLQTYDQVNDLWSQPF